MGLRITPAFDDEVGDIGTVLRADGGKKGVHGRSVFDSEGIAAVEDWLSFGKNSLIERKKAGHQGWPLVPSSDL